MTPHSSHRLWRPQWQTEPNVCVGHSVLFDSVTLWTVCSPPGSSVQGFPMQEYWSGLPCPFPGNLPNPGIAPTSFMSPALTSGFFTIWHTREALKTDMDPPRNSISQSCSHSCLTFCDFMDDSPPGSSVQGFPRQEYWCGLPFPSPGDLPDPGIEPVFLASPALAGEFFTSWATTNISGEKRLLEIVGSILVSFPLGTMNLQGFILPMPPTRPAPHPRHDLIMQSALGIFSCK